VLEKQSELDSVAYDAS
jgi:hypothetical protein